MVCVACAGGERLTCRGSWYSEGANTSWECAWRAVCTGGSVLWDSGDQLRIEAVDSASPGFTRQKREIPAPELQPLALTQRAGCIDDMLTAIKAGPPADDHWR
jgi:hypothetical protein